VGVVIQEIFIIRRNCKKIISATQAYVEKERESTDVFQGIHMSFNAFWGTLDKETCSIVAKLPDDDTCATKIGDKFETPQYSKLEGFLDIVRCEAVA
jgi:hypothetical protein